LNYLHRRVSSCLHSSAAPRRLRAALSASTRARARQDPSQPPPLPPRRPDPHRLAAPETAPRSEDSPAAQVGASRTEGHEAPENDHRLLPSSITGNLFPSPGSSAAGSPQGSRIGDPLALQGAAGTRTKGHPAANVPCPGGATNAPAAPCPAPAARGGLAELGQEKGWGGKQREDRTEEHTKGGRRRARSRVTWRSPEETPEPSLPQKHLDGIMAASGSASGGSWPLSAHPTCVRGLPGSPRPLSCSHLSCRCPGFARTWRSPKLQPCTPGVGYSLEDGASGLGVPGSTETDPPPAMNPR